MRLGNAKLDEEIVRHARIVMLASMHQTVAQRPALHRPFLNCADDRCDLYEIWSGASNDVYEHSYPSLRQDTDDQSGFRRDTISKMRRLAKKSVALTIFS